MKRAVIFIGLALLLLVFAVGCAKQPEFKEPPQADLTTETSTGPAAETTVEDTAVSDIETSISEVDDLDTDLDLSELDSLDQELADLESLELE